MEEKQQTERIAAHEKKIEDKLQKLKIKSNPATQPHKAKEI